MSDYAITQSEKSAAGLGMSLRSQTIRERLEEQKRVVSEHLAGLNSAIEFLDKNPSFESFHDILRKVGF